jgi:predicted nucleotidyltransferase
MRNILLDVSQENELLLHAEVVTDVNAAAADMNVAVLIVGAFARDLHFRYGCGINALRGTADIDIAIAVNDWPTFEELRSRLIERRRFTSHTVRLHRLRHVNGLPVDLVPFTGVETPERRIAWPPANDIVMDVFGFREALATARQVIFPGPSTVNIVSLPGLGLLKLVAWNDRHLSSPGKDATDLAFIIRNYLPAGNEARLWDEFGAWTEDEDFDVEHAAARMLGYDIGVLLGKANTRRIVDILTRESGTADPGRLAREMEPRAPELMRSLLASLLKGVHEAG